MSVALLAGCGLLYLAFMCMCVMVGLLLLHILMAFASFLTAMPPGGYRLLAGIKGMAT